MKRKQKYEKYKKERDNWLKSRAAPKKRHPTPPQVVAAPSYGTVR